MKAEAVAVRDYLLALPRQAQSTLGLALFCALLLLWLVLSPLVGMWIEGEREIDATRPRLARLIGFEQSGDALSTSLRKARAELDRLVYPASAPASGAALQQLVRDLADDAGLMVARSQALGAESLEGLRRIRVNLELGGSAAELDAFLEALASARPIVVIDSLRVQPRRQRGAAASGQALAISIQLAAYRVAAQ